MPRIAFILPAAGSGQRMGLATPKPFIPLGIKGQPVILETLNRLTQYSAVSEIVIVLPPVEREALLTTYGDALRDAGVTATVPGGASRQESVARGLAALEKRCDLIAVHDAVRPFVSINLIRTLAQAAMTYGGSLPVLPVTDTVKRVVNKPKGLDNTVDIDGEVRETIPRDGLYAVQTPQIFQAGILTAAYQKAETLGEEVTDDATLVESAGGTVVGVRGERFNIKLTTPEDLKLAEALIQAGMV